LAQAILAQANFARVASVPAGTTSHTPWVNNDEVVFVCWCSGECKRLGIDSK